MSDLQPNPLTCLRCRRILEHAGTKTFREGVNWGVFGFLGELMEKSQSFDIYYCPRCGHVEFFASGIGQDYRRSER